jgi:flagellar basal body-associated protein FliL
MSKLLPIILVVVVLIGQGVIAYLFLPSAAEVAAVANGEAPEEAPAEDAHAEEAAHGDAHAEEPAAHGDAHGGGHGDSHGGGHGEEASEHAHEPSETTEVDLGAFKITVFQPAANTTLFVDFQLSGTVKTTQAGEFKHLFESNKFKFRDQVNVIIRSSGMEDFTDAGLGLLKNQILEKTNRALGKPLLLSVAFPEFSFIEQ